MQFPALSRALRALVPEGDRPVVAYTAVWPLAQAFDGPREALVESIAATLLDVVGERRTLLLPTYTDGYRDGFLDLDATPGLTGLVNESIRLMDGSRRTASAFFSFTARGPQSSELAALRPADAWGVDSLFEWIHREDALIVMLGAPFQMCSFLHRVEWLERVPYRSPKAFAGKIRLNGRDEELRETLFVRSLDPLAENVWPGAEALVGAALGSEPVGRGMVMAIGARDLVDALLPVVRRDPFAFVKEPESLRHRFSARAA